MDFDTKLFYDYTGSLLPNTTGSRASADTILQEWKAQKSKYLWDVMQHNLILKKEVSIEKDPDERLDDVFKMMRENDVDTFVRNFIRWTKEVLFESEDFKNYYHYNPDEEKASLWYRDSSPREIAIREVYQLFAETGLMSNTFKGENVDIPLPNGKIYTIKNGCKISKAIGKIMNKFHDSISKYCTDAQFENFRLRLSQVLNENYFTGTLALSIHPMDFVTASDNNSGWSSCMSWADDGEYHRGTVEMMNSECVVMAYLESATPMTINGQEWSNKKWREYFIVRPDLISGIKGYPYWNTELEALALNWLKELVEKSGIAPKPFCKDLMKYHPRSEFYCEEFDKSYYFEFSTQNHAMYNDFYVNNTYQMFISEATPLEDTIIYPGNATCMWCGKVLEEDDFESEGMVVCENCSKDSFRCDECGRWISPSEGYQVDGEYICDLCYQDLHYDAIYGEPHFDYNLTEISLFSKTYQRLVVFQGFFIPIDTPLDEIPCPVYKINTEWSHTFAVAIEDLLADPTNEVWNWIDYSYKSLQKYTASSCQIGPAEKIINYTKEKI